MLVKLEGRSAIILTMCNDVVQLKAIIKLIWFVVTKMYFTQVLGDSHNSYRILTLVIYTVCRSLVTLVSEAKNRCHKVIYVFIRFF